MDSLPKTLRWMFSDEASIFSGDRTGTTPRMHSTGFRRWYPGRLNRPDNAAVRSGVFTDRGRGRRNCPACLVPAGCGIADWSAGQAFWSWQEHVAGNAVPFPSVGDIGFLALVPLTVAGSAMVRRGQRLTRSTATGSWRGSVVTSSRSW
jgi:hypothetical protein